MSEKQEYTLDGAPIRQPHTPRDTFETPVKLMDMFLDCGRNLENLERPTAAQGHKISTIKVLYQFHSVA